MRKIEVDLGKLFELIHSAEDFGWYNIVPDVAEICGEVTQADIEEYAQQFLTPEMQEKGYGEADYNTAVETLCAALLS